MAEYAVGGGGAKSVSLLKEGEAMLSTLRRSFERQGNEVVYPVAEDDFEVAVDILSKESDAGIVIAPDEMLCGLTEIVESNTINLGCPSDSIKICADKMQTTTIFSENGIPAPKIVSGEEVGNEGGQRYVKKPRYGCASENIFIFNGTRKHEDLSLYDECEYIITEFIKGDDISSSVIVGNSSVLPLTINKQFIRKENGRLRYEGGLVPYSIGREAEREVMSLSKKVVTLLHCKGYVGIDFVLDEDGKAYVVDVNPRPTTSVVSIAKVLNYELADLILRAKFGTLPQEEEVKTEGCFTLNLS